MQIEYFKELKVENKENIKDVIQNIETSIYTKTNNNTIKTISKDSQSEENNTNKFLQKPTNTLEEENFNYIITNGEQSSSEKIIDLIQINIEDNNKNNGLSNKMRQHIFKLNSIFELLKIPQITNNFVTMEIIEKIEKSINIIKDNTLKEKESLSEISLLLEKNVYLSKIKDDFINEDIELISKKRNRSKIDEKTKNNGNKKMGRKSKNSGEKGEKDDKDVNNGLHKMLHSCFKIVFDICIKLVKEIDENIKLFYPGINQKDLRNTKAKQDYLDKSIKNIFCEYISKESKKDEFKKNKAIIEKKIPKIIGKEEKKELLNEIISKPFRYYFRNYVNNIKIMEGFITFDEDVKFEKYEKNTKMDFKGKGLDLVNNKIKVRKSNKIVNN